jgi:pimeloyl-ACP methyl ester carboxylesterase
MLNTNNTNLPSLGTDFRLPIYFFQGTEDEVMAPALARKYFDEINAPHKEYVAFDRVGHFAVWSMPDKFLQELIARVRPLSTTACSRSWIDREGNGV